MSEFSETPLFVVFTGLNRYTAQIDRLEDAAVARVMCAYYEITESVVRGTGGRLVKFIGDSALVVYRPDESDRAVVGLLDLKGAVDSLMVEQGWDCRLTVRAHFGSVAAGDFGGRYDVLGKTVNVAARLDASSGVALSAEAFRRLGRDARARFKKHTPPVTYIRLEDSHKPRWAKG
jgi:class 3 adenylate cyclase